MVEKENLDVRTITLGISLLDCIAVSYTHLKAAKGFKEYSGVLGAGGYEQGACDTHT